MRKGIGRKSHVGIRAEGNAETVSSIPTDTISKIVSLLRDTNVEEVSSTEPNGDKSQLVVVYGE